MPCTPRSLAVSCGIPPSVGQGNCKILPDILQPNLIAKESNEVFLGAVSCCYGARGNILRRGLSY